MSATKASNALERTIGPITAAVDAKLLEAQTLDSMRSWYASRLRSLHSRIDAGTRPIGGDADADVAACYEELVYERWRAQGSSGGLPAPALAAFYRVKHLVPRAVQMRLRRGLAKRKAPPGFPAWPFENAGRELLEAQIAGALIERGVDRVSFPWFWPDGALAAATLTHDVESADGLARAAGVAALEERFGFHSSFNVVSEWYPVDPALIEELRSRGHEIGSHALKHDRSLFASRAAFERDLPRLREAARELGAVGFRSPATHRVVEWLGELPFEYDCTMPHSDPYEPIPGGTGTIWPFFHGEVVELSYTAPQDHTLFNVLGHTDSGLWRSQLAAVAGANGLFQVLTHPDAEYLGRPVIRAAYEELLEAMAARADLWVALPAEVASWWRRRARGETAPADGVARWDGSGIVLEPLSPAGGS